MKSILKFISTVTVLAMVLASFTVFTHAESYVVPEGTVELNNYDLSKSITSITIPSSVTTIGIGVFRECGSLTSVTVSPENPVYYSEGNCIIEKSTGKLVAGCGSSVIPHTVTSIGDYAFYSSPSLTTIEIPDSVRYIGKKAFSNCTSLTRMHLPDSVRYIDDQVFNECTSLKELTLSNSLTYLPVGMCYKCSSLEKLVIPHSVTSVEGNLFQGASLEKGVYIPSSLKNVTKTAFNNHRYTPFYYEGTFNEWKKIEAYLDPYFTSYIQEGLRCLYPYEEKLVYVDDNVSLNIKVVNGEGTIETVNYAIGDVVLPDEVEGYPITKVEIAAFAAKPNLTSLTFPDTITQLGNRCFYNSDALTEVIIPEGVTEIPPGFLLSCDGITEIELPDSIEFIGNSAFSSCKNLESIVIPDNVTAIDNAAFKGCTSLRKVVLPDSCTIFGTSVFAETPDLKRVTLPQSIAYISASMFTLSGLEEITIPKSVKAISQNAFSGSQLKEVVIPGNVTDIGQGAFFGCDQLEKVIMEEGVQNLYPSVFSDCPSLASVTIPGTLKKADYTVFSKCPLLSDVCYTNQKPTVNITFYSDVVERSEPVFANCTFSADGTTTYGGQDASKGIDYPYAEKDGHILLGWALSPDEDAPLLTFPFYSNNDVVLYAKWAKRDECIIMKINEKAASLYGKVVTNDVAPIIEQNRTMLPVRFVAESLGAKVEWVNDARYIRITGADGNVIDMRVDEKGTLANGFYQELDVPPFVRNDRTYTPVRFIAESLGAKVYWNQATQEAILIK